MPYSSHILRDSTDFVTDMVGTIHCVIVGRLHLDRCFARERHVLARFLLPFIGSIARERRTCQFLAEE